MYDLRRTMYDLDYSARCAEGCMDSAHALPCRGELAMGRRWRLTPPMYDGRSTIYDL